MTNIPQIFAISISPTKGTRKQNVLSVELKKDFGIIGDAHAGPGPRQVSLLAWESVQHVQPPGIVLKPGDFAENITTQGMDLLQLKLGDQLKIGKEVVLEISQIGKSCHGQCEIARLTGDCVMPREGIFARVLCGGTVRVSEGISCHLSQSH